MIIWKTEIFPPLMDKRYKQIRMRNKINSIVSMKSDSQEPDNPENAFSKIMMIPQDAEPVKECKMLLQSMKEELTFEKNMFHRTYYQEIPRSDRLERENRENYLNYQRLLSYSKKKKNAEEFQKRSCGRIKVQVKKNRARTLKEFIDDKKLKMLTEESKEQFNDLLIENILTDEKVRQKLFDESILLERLNYIKRQHMRSQSEACPVPKKFRGLDPKHMRVPEETEDEQSFYRRKYIHNQKTFQYFRKALKTESSLLRNKQRDNNLVIANLMTHFKDQALLTERDHLSQQITQCIRRLFLAYANSGTEDVETMYKKIDKQSMYKLLQDFNLSFKEKPKIKQIIEKQQLTQFYFLEIIHLLSIDSEDQFYTDTNQFFVDNIINKHEIYLPKEWQIYNQNKSFITRHLKVRKFRQKIELIYNAFIGTHERELFNFDQMVEVMWLVRIYPFMISKKKLRFFYLYSQSKETGLTIEQITDIYVCIAISREGDWQDNLREIVEIVLNFSKRQPKKA